MASKVVLHALWEDYDSPSLHPRNLFGLFLGDNLQNLMSLTRKSVLSDPFPKTFSSSADILAEIKTVLSVTS